MRVWIVGQYKSGQKPEGIVWEFQGIFDSEEKAVGACRDRNYFIFATPMFLNEQIPHETIINDEDYYPLVKIEEEQEE